MAEPPSTQGAAEVDAAPELRLATAASPLDVIADAVSLEAAIERLAAGKGPVAVDAERAMGFRYFPRAYLVQVYRRGAGTALIDPTQFSDLEPLQRALGAEEWIIHAASQDLASLRELGLEPGALFDTELGARLAGFDRVGLAAVAQRLIGVRLRKEHGASDWSRRPIPESWLEYAALDVELLPDIRDALAAELESQGKSEIARQEFAYALARQPKAVAAEPWRRISGLHTVRDRAQLAVARELWMARDELGRELDLAPGRLIPDRSLIVAVQSNPATKQRLAARKDFEGQASRTQLDRWWAAIEAGRASTDPPTLRVRSDELPPARFWGSKKPAAAARYQAARSALADIAASMDIPQENLLAPDALRRLAWSGSAEAEAEVAAALATLDARPWQIAATARAIATAFVDARQATPDQQKTGS